mmetsp:Transcript_11390/g.30257  ORF Transcript_11390/g.30257 Transcript_11390/m.30257 type:complete len:210 (+) Transcript_11390:2-631(+)
MGSGGRRSAPSASSVGSGGRRSPEASAVDARAAIRPRHSSESSTRRQPVRVPVVAGAPLHSARVLRELREQQEELLQEEGVIAPRSVSLPASLPASLQAERFAHEATGRRCQAGGARATVGDRAPGKLPSLQRGGAGLPEPPPRPGVNHPPKPRLPSMAASATGHDGVSDWSSDSGLMRSGSRRTTAAIARRTPDRPRKLAPLSSCPSV